jgi:ATP-dependent RNA helicase DDX1
MTPCPLTDNMHLHDAPSPSSATAESLSEGIKRLKYAKLRQVIDAYNMEQCMIFCRTNFDVVRALAVTQMWCFYFVYVI